MDSGKRLCVSVSFLNSETAPGPWASQTSVVLTKGLWSRDSISFLKQASAPAKGLCRPSQCRNSECDLFGDSVFTEVIEVIEVK